VRVPMQGTGAEQLVVAMNFRNGKGAKGLYCPVLVVGQPRVYWEDPINGTYHFGLLPL